MKKKCLSCGAPFTLSGSRWPRKCSRKGAGHRLGKSVSKSLKTKVGKPGFELDLGSLLLAQIQDQTSQPISFTTPEGDRVKIWTSNHKERKGGEVYWRVNLDELKRIAQQHCGFSEPSEATSHVARTEGNSRIPLTRLKPDSPARDSNCVQPDIWPRPGATRSGSTSRLRRNFKS
jgi:hypothetical protein